MAIVWNAASFVACPDCFCLSHLLHITLESAPYQQQSITMHINQLVTVCKLYGVTQDAQTEEVQAYFCQWGPVNSCQLAHNDSALIALIAQQGHLQVPSLTLMACTSNLQRLPACCGVAMYNRSLLLCTGCREPLCDRQTPTHSFLLVFAKITWCQAHLCSISQCFIEKKRQLRVCASIW